ncbi:hypothetical protein HYPSUDRAFT_50009 [Hypholoma sublateritium FD-334 SS-4]|uniref:Uncharacterized protein n=1 Tax=Hypholoma sublateritium (strain FD-334 SS-4) TaxID=945553 RepID=A0A0D2KF84_HYPSF|nr:hypothetical protein HYPSUDRAFT_50009 [Hypholoma sublateritium FD-334 SS-4]
MQKKLFKNGWFARVFNKKLQDVFDSRLMQTCSRIAPPLPSPLSAPLWHLNGEMVYLRDQVINLLELQHTCITGITARGDLNIAAAFIFTQIAFLTHFDDPFLREHVEEMAPSFIDWYRWIMGKKIGLTKAVRDYRESRSIFAHTPTETAWRYKAEASERKVPLRPLDGYIQIDFFSNLERGRYRSGVLPAPDFTTFEAVYNPSGVDLRPVREKLGIESLAIIANKGPFRPTFELAREDQLSLMATLDLTKEFTQPIRIFEPRVANATRAARAVRVPVYLVCVFIAAIARLLCGTPSRDIAYLSVLYGAPFARAYASAGRVTSAARTRVWNGAQLFFRCVLALCVAPLMALVAGARVAGTGVSLALGLDMKGWLVAGAICWFTAAEIHSCTH